MARSDETDRAADPTRREFFRTFGRETVRSAGSLIGTAAEIRRAGSAAARELFDPAAAAVDEVSSPRGGQSRPDEFSPPAEEPAATFRSAYRLSGDALLLLDQRELPGRLTVVTCREPSEVASAIRSGVVNGGPVLGEIAAYALWATLARAPREDAAGRDQLFHAGANTLRGAAREIHALKSAVDRMEARYDAETAGPGADPVVAMRTEADAIASEAQVAHAALGRSGAEAISGSGTGPLNLLMHADMGPLSCGLVGTGTAVLQSLLTAGHAIHIWLTEAAPSDQGARLSALQLTQADVPHTVIADSAVGWLFDSRPLDAVLLRGDNVAANGDMAGLIGSLNVARLAADATVPVYAVTPTSAFDDDLAEARSLLPNLRSSAETLALEPRGEGDSRSAVFGVRLNPTIDVVPRDLITAYLTENGPRPGGRA